MMNRINKKQLTKILLLHKKWLNGIEGGVCADLTNVDLRYADLTNVDLIGTDLTNVDLTYAD